MDIPKDIALNKMPLNFFGALYPSYDHNQLIEIFKIRPSDKVLDIGGGHNPFSRADYIIEIDLSEGIHRDGQGIPPELKGRYTEADLHQLPFKDKSMDFVFCSHVLEHVSDPEKACREIIRVGKRGYIESPRKWVEFFAGYPSHQWLIDVIDGEIIFEKKQFMESPYLNSILPAVWRSKRLEERALKQFLNISCIQFYWEDRFKFRVIDNNTDIFDYSNPNHAALSHFYFAKNILMLDAPPEHGLFHAERTVMLCPDVDIFWVLCAVYALILNNMELWSRSSKFLLEKKILNFKDILLFKLGVKKRIISKLKQIVVNHAPSQ